MLWGARTLAPTELHPGLDQRLEHRDAPELAAHLQSCPACRVDLSLYEGTLGRGPHAPAWRRQPLWIGLAAGLGIGLLVLIAVFGTVRAFPTGGPFTLGLLLSSAGVGAFLLRQHARDRSSWSWLLTPLVPVVIGLLASGLGLGQLTRALAQRPEVGAHLHQAIPMALVVEQSGWVLGDLGLVVAMALGAPPARSELSWRVPGVVLVLGGLLWGLGLWLGLDGVGPALAWLSVVGLAALTPRQAPSWAGAASLLVALALGRIVLLAHGVVSPLSDLPAGSLGLAWSLLALLAVCWGRRTAPRAWLAALGLGGVLVLGMIWVEALWMALRGA